MRMSSSWIVAPLIAAGACFAWGQAQAPTEPLIKHTFAEDVAGWVAIGPKSKIVVFHDPALGAPTTGAMRHNYEIKKGGFNALYLPISGGSIDAAKSLKFSVRTDQSTLLVVALQEEEGGRYTALIHAPKDRWQPVELAIEDFALAMDKDDPKDPNAKLDLNMVTSLAVADLSQFFAQVEDPGAKALFDIKPGNHTLYLDDFTVTKDTVPVSTSSAGNDVRLDTFSHPQLAWFGLGAVNLSRVLGKPMEGAGLKADYRQAPGKMVVLSRTLSPWVLTQAKALSFDAAATKGTKLIVQVEERDGGKYNATVDVPSGEERKQFKLPFADFKPADDAKDPNGKLDVGSIKTLNLIDATGMLGGTEQDNTLWIGNLLGVA